MNEGSANRLSDLVLVDSKAETLQPLLGLPLFTERISYAYFHSGFAAHCRLGQGFCGLFMQRLVGLGGTVGASFGAER